VSSSRPVFVLATSFALAACGGSAFSPVTSDDGGASGDAASDASTSDASDASPSDASASDARAPDAPPQRSWCATQPLTAICEDFDDVADVSALAFKWQGAVIGNGTIAMIRDPLAPSAPHAFGATAGNNDAALLLHPPIVVGNATTVRVEYDLRIDRQGVGLFDAAALVTLLLGTDPNADTAVFLYISYGGGLTLGWSDPASAGRGFHYQSIPNATPTAGKWDGRWGFTVSLFNGSLRVLHDGADVGGTDNGLGASELHPISLTLGAGIAHDTGTVGTVSILVDNLVMDLK